MREAALLLLLHRVFQLLKSSKVSTRLSHPSWTKSRSFIGSVEQRSSTVVTCISWLTWWDSMLNPLHKRLRCKCDLEVPLSIQHFSVSVWVAATAQCVPDTMPTLFLPPSFSPFSLCLFHFSLTFIQSYIDTHTHKWLCEIAVGSEKYAAINCLPG